MENEDELEISPPSLEVVDNHGVSPLFPDDAMASALVKLTSLEGLFNVLNKDYSFPDFIRQILITLMNAVKCEAGSFLEVDQQNRVLFFRSVVGSSSDTLVSFTIPIGQGVVGHVAESGTSLLVDNAPENQVHLKSIAKAVGFEARNLVAIPVFIRGRVFGVIELLNRIGEESFSQKDLELLNYLSQMSSKVIETRLMMNWVKKHE